MTPFLHILSEATRQVNLMVEVGVGFFFWVGGGWRQEENLKIDFEIAGRSSKRYFSSH